MGLDDDKEYKIFTSDVREVMRTKAGRNFVWELLSACNLYVESFTGNSQTFYLEGKRSVGLRVMQWLEDADPTLYARLLLSKQEIEVIND